VFATDHILELVYHKKVLADVVNSSAGQKAIVVHVVRGVDHSQGTINARLKIRRLSQGHEVQITTKGYQDNSF
jgi:hypothetical protein